MSRTPDNETILDHVDGWQVGHPNGIIICSGCSARVEADDDQLWTAYVTSARNRYNQYALTKPKCPDCHKTEINTSTGFVDELIITWRPVKKEGKGEQNYAEPVEVVHRAGP